MSSANNVNTMEYTRKNIFIESFLLRTFLTLKDLQQQLTFLLQLSPPKMVHLEHHKSEMTTPPHFHFFKDSAIFYLD